MIGEFLEKKTTTMFYIKYIGKIGSDKYLLPQTVEIFDIMPSNTMNLVPFKLHATL